MCDNEIRDLIRQEVLDRVSTGRRSSFTAYDITTAIRAKSNIRNRHQEIKAVVHGMYEAGEMPGYSRELRNYGGAEPAWYYFHRVASTSVSDPTVARRSPSASMRSYPTTPLTAGGSGSTQKGCKADGRGTICVPAGLVRGLGLKHGSKAVVVANPSNGTLIITTGMPPSRDGDDTSLKVRMYTVDKDENVRITRSTQILAGLGSESSFTAEADQQQIVLKPA